MTIVTWKAGLSDAIFHISCCYIFAHLWSMWVIWFVREIPISLLIFQKNFCKLNIFKTYMWPIQSRIHTRISVCFCSNNFQFLTYQTSDLRTLKKCKTLGIHPCIISITPHLWPCSSFFHDSLLEMWPIKK